MSTTKVVVSLLSFLGLTSLAVSAAIQSDASAEAGCASCKSVYYPGGGMMYGCEKKDDGRIFGPTYCRIQGGPSGWSCSTEGYGSCSG
jgi:hypothetical protein